jgi:hypothetical protein
LKREGGREMGDLPPFVIHVAAGLCWLAGYILGFFVQKFAKRNTQGCPDREMHMRVNDL